MKGQGNPYSRQKCSSYWKGQGVLALNGWHQDHGHFPKADKEPGTFQWLTQEQIKRVEPTKPNHRLMKQISTAITACKDVQVKGNHCRWFSSLDCM